MPTENVPAVRPEDDMNTRLAQPKQIEALLTNRAEELEAILDDTGITVKRFTSTVVHALAANPDVMSCDRGSVLLAVLDAAKMGLEPTGAYGGGYLVKHKNKAAFWVDWRGYIKMAMRSGQLKKADAFVVWSNDEFEYELGTNQHITHRPFLGSDAERGEPTHVYAIAWLTNGTQVLEVMSWDEVMAIMKRAPSQNGPWKTDPLEMARKTPIRRVFKRIPNVITPQLAYALEQEDATWDETRAEATVATPPSANGGRRGRILGRLAGASSSPEAAQPAEAAEVSEEKVVSEESEEELLDQLADTAVKKGKEKS